MPHHRPPTLFALLWLAALTAGSATADSADEAAPSSRTAGERTAPQPGDYADPMHEWLDEVKAQRQAWEERRRAAKEAINARRRLADPWGAAQQEAREKENQRRHDAMLEQVERDRETFRNQGPWQSPAPWDQGPPPPVGQPIPAGAQSAIQPGIQPETGGAPEPVAPDSPAQSPGQPRAYPPAGWDNRWYYRGY